MATELRENRFDHVVAATFTGSGEGLTNIELASATAPLPVDSAVFTDALGHITTAPALPASQGGTGADLSASTGGVARTVTITDGVSAIGPGISAYSAVVQTLPLFDGTGGLHTARGGITCNGAGDATDADREFAQLSWDSAAHTFKLASTATGTGVQRSLTLSAPSVVIDGTASSTYAPTHPEDFVRKAELDAISSGVVWQQTVLAIVAAPPPAPTLGDRYIAADPTTEPGWTANNIYTRAAGSWTEEVPAIGWTLFVTGGSLYAGRVITYSDDNTWILIGWSFDHYDLLHRGTNTHDTIDAHLAATTTDPHAGQDLRSTASVVHKNLTLADDVGIPSLTFATSGPISATASLMPTGTLSYVVTGTPSAHVAFANAAVTAPYFAPDPLSDALIIGPPARFPALTSSTVGAILEVYGEQNITARFARIDGLTTYFADLGVSTTGELSLDASSMRIAPRLGIGAAASATARVNIYETTGPHIQMLGSAPTATASITSTSSALNIVHASAPVQIGAASALIALNTTDVTSTPIPGAVAAITSRGGIVATGRVHGARVSCASAPVDARDVWRLADQQVRDTITRGPTGFIAPGDATMSIDDLSRIFTLTPSGASFDYYVAGARTTVSAPLTVTIPNVTGLYYISIQSNTLVAALTVGIEERVAYPYVASVYWRAAAPARAVHMSDERHYTCATPRIGRAIDYGCGLIYYDGLTPANFNIPDPVTDASAQFAISSGNILNEEVPVAIAAKATPASSMRIYYRISTGEWESVTSTGAFHSSAQQLYYGAPGLAAVPELHYVLGHIFTTHSYPTASAAPFAFIGLHEYATLEIARVAIMEEMRELRTLNIPFSTVFPIASVIYQFSAAWTLSAYRARIIEPNTGIAFIDWRRDMSQGRIIVTDHSLLSGLSHDDHAQYVQVSGRAGEAITLHNPNISTPYESSLACNNSGDLVFTCGPTGIFSFQTNAAQIGGSLTVSGASLTSQICAVQSALRIGSLAQYTSIARVGATTTVASSTAAQAIVFDSSIASLTLNGAGTITGALGVGGTLAAKTQFQLADASANTATLTIAGGSTTFSHSLAGATHTIGVPTYVSSSLEATAGTGAISTDGGIRAAKRVYAAAMTCLASPLAATDVLRLSDFQGSALNLTPQFARAGIGAAPDPVIPLTVSAAIGAQLKLVSSAVVANFMVSGANLYTWIPTGTFYLNHDGASYAGPVSIPCPTAASSPTVGALVVAGGIAGGAGLHLAGSINCVGIVASGAISANSVTCAIAPASPTSVLRLTDLQGGASFNLIPQVTRIGVGQAPHASIPLAVTATSGPQVILSDGANTASIRAAAHTYLYGAGTLYLGYDGASLKSPINIQSTIAASDASTAALVVAGGIAAGNFWTAGAMRSASATVTGALSAASVSATGLISSTTMQCSTAPAFPTDVMRLSDLSGSALSLTPQFTRAGIGAAPDATIPLTIATSVAGNAHLIMRNGADSAGFYVKPSSAGLAIWAASGRLFLNENAAGATLGGVTIPSAIASGDGVGALIVTGGVYAGNAYIKNGLTCATFGASTINATSISCASAPALPGDVMRFVDFTNTGALIMTPQFARLGAGRAPDATIPLAITSSATTVPQIALSNGTKVGGIHVNASAMYIWSDAGPLSLNADSTSSRGTVLISSVVPAASASSAALVIAGGVSATSAYIAGGATITGLLAGASITCTAAPLNATDVLRKGDIDTLIINPLLARTGNATSKTIAPIAFAGGLGVNGNSIFAGLTVDTLTSLGAIMASDATASLSKLTGAVTVAGGLGLAGDLYARATCADASIVGGAPSQCCAIVPSAVDGAVIVSGPTTSSPAAMFEASLRRSTIAKTYAGPANRCVGTIASTGSIANGKYVTTTPIAGSLTWVIDASIDPGLIGCVRWRWTSPYTGTAGHAGDVPFVALSTGITTSNAITIYQTANSTTFATVTNGAGGAAIVLDATGGSFSFTSGTEYEMELNFDLNLNGKLRLYINGVKVTERTVTTAQALSARTLLAVGQLPWSPQIPLGAFRDVQVFKFIQHTADTYTSGVYSCNDSTAISGRVVSDSLALTAPLDWTKSATLSVDPSGVLTSSAIISGVAPTADPHLTTRAYVTEKLNLSESTAPYSGSQFLWKWYEKMSQGIASVAVFSGDSTTQSGAELPFMYMPTAVGHILVDRGFDNVSVINAGHGGQRITDWVSTYIAQDLALVPAPDIYILRWGLNDMPPATSDPAAIEVSLRQGLQMVRSTPGFSLASGFGILLMTPNVSLANGRTRAIAEQLSAIYRQAAVDFGCAFLDTYAMFPFWDDTSMWMDTAGLHPRANFNGQMASCIYDVIIPRYIDSARRHLSSARAPDCIARTVTVTAPPTSSFYLSGASLIPEHHAAGLLSVANATGAATCDGTYITLPALGTLGWGTNQLVDGGTTGCVRMKITPSWTTWTSSQILWWLGSMPSDAVNATWGRVLYAKWYTNGSIQFIGRDDAGTADVIIATWSAGIPVSGIEYDIEINFDVAAGNSTLHVNGVPIGAASAVTVARTGPGIRFSIGGYSGSAHSQWTIKYRDVALFLTKQHAIGDTFAITTDARKTVIARDGITATNATIAGALVVSGTASGQTPTLAAHFATKGYVDSAPLASPLQITSPDTLQSRTVAVANTTGDVLVTDTGVERYAVSRWDDLQLLASARLSGGSSVTLVDFFTPTGGTAIQQIAFSGTSNQICHFSGQTPHTMKFDTSLQPHMHWSTTTTMTAGQNARMQLNWAIRPIGDTFVTTSYSYTETITLTGGVAPAFGHSLTSFANRTITPGGFFVDGAFSYIIIAQLTRLATTDAADTFTGNIFLLGFDIHIEKNAILGSKTT